MFTEHVRESVDGISLYCREYDGEQRVPALLCLPGLSRNSRDFEPLLTALAGQQRALCPDLRGRGRSGWDDAPARYRPDTYVADLWHWLDVLGEEKVAVVGTSLGGILGMMLAAQQPDRVVGLVLNDVGTQVPRAALQRITNTLRRAGPVADWPAAAQSVRQANAPAFGPLHDDDWFAFARRLYRERDGQVVPDFDPALLHAATADEDMNLAPLFDALPALMPILLLRGANSDVLPSAVAADMRARRPSLRYAEVPQRGHAPFLDEPEAVQAVREWLLAL